MTGYIQISLRDMLSEIGEDAVKKHLSNFSCPLNKDVERFLTRSSCAIEFCRQGIAQTTLVFTSFKGALVLIGYYTIALKNVIIPTATLSSSLRKRVAKFGTYDRLNKGYCIAMPLIAQLGKNYANNYNNLIRGDELLALACECVSHAQRVIGGRFTYLECEDTPKLVDFYSENGFVNFGRRLLDPDEQYDYSKNYLIQMIKYLK